MNGKTSLDTVCNTSQDAFSVMDAETIGWSIVYVGLGLLVVGGVVLLLGRVLDLGNLPGDLVFKGENVRVYIPLATMIVLSVLLTLLLNLVLRLFR